MLEILTPIWHAKAETARAVRQRIRSVLEWAIAMDLAGRVWTVPATRMKAKREHRIPLCRRAVEILEAARALGGGDLVFPMRSGKPIAMSTLPKILEYHGIAAVAHGFRSYHVHWRPAQCGYSHKVLINRKLLPDSAA